MISLEEPIIYKEMVKGMKYFFSWWFYYNLIIGHQDPKKASVVFINHMGGSIKLRLEI